MKRIIIILLSVVALTAVAQEAKKVAILDPICRDKSVNTFFQQMVRGAMESAVTASEEYEAYDRSAFDMIQKEQAFQRTGAVSDSQIKKMGEMAGVDYVLVSEVTAYNGYLSAIVKILNVTTGKYDKSVDDYSQLTPEDVKKKCREMASSLFGSLHSSSSTRPGKSSSTARGNDLNQGRGTSTNVQVSAPSNESTMRTVKTNNRISTSQTDNEYVDLGLPSGTLWKAENENCGLINHEQAVALYGNSLPTFEQMTELTTYCKWVWLGDGYHITGPNGKAIILPVSGYRDVYGTKMAPKQGFYWSSSNAELEAVFANYKMSDKQVAKLKSMLTVEEVEAGCFYSLHITSKSNKIEAKVGILEMAIRLVK